MVYCGDVLLVGSNNVVWWRCGVLIVFCGGGVVMVFCGGGDLWCDGSVVWWKRSNGVV